MEDLVNLIIEKLEDEKQTGEMERQLNKLVTKEDKFVKEFSKEKWKEYFDLNLEQQCYHEMMIEQSIQVTIKVIKEIYK